MRKVLSLILALVLSLGLTTAAYAAENTQILTVQVPADVTLTFAADLPPVTARPGTVIDLAQYNPKRSGYAFTGWYTEPELVNPITEITLMQDTTVYPKWTEIVNPIVPPTGDDSHICLWLGIAILSGIAIIVLTIHRKKKTETKQ